TMPPALQKRAVIDAEGSACDGCRGPSLDNPRHRHQADIAAGFHVFTPMVAACAHSREVRVQVPPPYRPHRSNIRRFPQGQWKAVEAFRLKIQLMPTRRV